MCGVCPAYSPHKVRRYRRLSTASAVLQLYIIYAFSGILTAAPVVAARDLGSSPRLGGPRAAASVSGGVSGRRSGGREWRLEFLSAQGPIGRTPPRFRDERIDPLTVIRWKDIFEALEDALDAAETAANVVGNIVVKNA